MTITVRVTFDGGDTLTTALNTDLAGARAYYIGKSFNFGIEEDRPATAVRVERVPDYRVVAKGWHDRVNGNSYTSARVYNQAGEVVAYLPFQYSYGDQYVHDALDVLITAGLEPLSSRDEPVWGIVKDGGCTLGLKRDAKSWGEK